ncbi:major facilitator superfamily domain-containing protein [Linnemannia elongata]|nr:major facilitator superfamily domain-containing protein [Linnemannia elongata]
MTPIDIPVKGPVAPVEKVDPTTLSKFQQLCLKSQPLMLYVVSLAQFLDIVNGASMTVAMLPIAKELKFETQQQQWLISSYALSFGGLLLIAGRMGDLFGHRRVFLGGLFWFGLFSLVNGFSKSPVMLCISRALQGIGAAAQIPTALALIAIKYPAGVERTRALSVFGAIGAMGAVTGLLLSGALTSTVGWQWIFFISAIMSVILFILGLFAIPQASGLHGENPRIDFGGSFTATGGIVCVIYYISAGVETGWASVQTLPVLCIGLVLLAIFFVIEKRISYPIMPFHVWKHRAFSTSFALIFIMQAVFQGYLYFTTLTFQEVLGYSIMRTSLSYLVHGLTAMVFYSILGRLLPRLPLKPIIALGFIFLGVSSLLFAFVTENSTYWVLPFISLICNVLGLGMVMLPAQITALRDASDDDQGVVGAIYNVGLQIGAPFGLAILTVISGKLNGDHKGERVGGPVNMHGYKYALLGDVALAALGLVVTLILLPSVKPTKAENNVPASLEEAGVAASSVMDQDKESVTTDVGVPTAFSKAEYVEEGQLPDKTEYIEEQHGGKTEYHQDGQELNSPQMAEEIIKAGAKVQY